jgi:hypothetical protein
LASCCFGFESGIGAVLIRWNDGMSNQTDKPDGAQSGCLTGMLKMALGALIGAVIGYIVGAGLACFVIMPNSNLCGLVGLITALVGLVIGTLVAG